MNDDEKKIYYKEFIYGGVSGVIAILISHPIDTIKTLNQVKKQTNINYMDLYKGIKYPIICNFLMNGTVFHLEKSIYDLSSTNSIYKNSNNINEHLFSGLMTGILTSPINNYFELYKIQNQCSLLKSRFSITSSFRRNSFLKRVNISVSTLKKNLPLLGLKSTLIRDSIGNSIYFGSYFYLNEKFKKYKIFKNNNSLISFISGGLAGLFSWTPTYWIDTLKTRIQSNNYKTYKSAFNKGNLMVGFRYCAIRSFVYNAIVFMTHDKLMNL